MIVYNLYFLNANNGMLHYFKDYADPVNGLVILKRKNSFLHESLRGYEIRFAVNIFHLYAIILFLKYEKIFTPTPHPLPFIRRQVIVFHDLYPFFENRISLLKRLLIFIATSTSRVSIGHVNYSIIERLKKMVFLSNSIFLYMPNFPPYMDLTRLKLSEIERVGYMRYDLVLTGTDSRKKNYDELFHAISALENSELRIGIYGVRSHYIDELFLNYPNLKLELVNPDQIDLVTVLKLSKRLVSVAKGEGFARPIFVALQLGVPVDVLDDPVFREFYDGLISFNFDITSLLQVCVSGDYFLPSREEVEEFRARLLSAAHHGKAIALRRHN